MIISDGHSQEDKQPLPIRRNLCENRRKDSPKEPPNRRRGPEAPQRHIPPPPRRHHQGDRRDAVGHQDAASHSRERAHGDEGGVVGRKGVGEGEYCEDEGTG